MTIDDSRLRVFVDDKMLPDAAAAMSVVMALIGDKTGLFKAMAGAGPLTSAALAARTGTEERYVREWLSALAAAGWIDYDRERHRFELTAEQAEVFANDNSPDNLQGTFEVIDSLYRDHEKIVEAFRTGAGVGWGDHSQCLFSGTERFFRPAYARHLVPDWIRALDGVEARLREGAVLADVGCGRGASTLIMAKAFPQSTFVGFDLHDGSIEHASSEAKAQGVANARFETAHAKNYPGSDWDVVCFFDCLHDMGDPVGAMAHARRGLKPDGTVMVVEPFANDRLEDNLNLVGRMYYAGSTCVCTPASRSQEVGLALGAQAGEARLRGVAEEAGFRRFRRAAETRFNMVFEARP